VYSTARRAGVNDYGVNQICKVIIFKATQVEQCNKQKENSCCEKYAQRFEFDLVHPTTAIAAAAVRSTILL
jgi:hypothetical protein